ncbi:LTA synthase family protein [Candidatus Dependentiae bacterium]|nr:LTA synthase family protein [Candidatus Dependentiae bacterium]
MIIILSIIPVIFFYSVDTSIPSFSNNVYENNLAANGIYCLFSAFRHNTLDYDEFYTTYNLALVFKNLKKNFCTDYKENDDTNFSIQRKIISNNPEKQYNIILVVIESMSSEFLKSFGNNENLTPNLDKLAENGILYTNLFATGTRTIRGLEAISLSIPPIPGQSILKRPNSENLDFCISRILQKKNYDLKFIYGGFGYFDNMNYFFKNNGFKIIDRSDMKGPEISFSNAWGVCDEDLFNKVIKEASASYKEHKFFFTMVMTTSNHRPFTYPENKIDIKSGTGRNGAVKYCDFAIGKLIDSAKKQGWFDKTIFVFTADHCASSAGKVKLAVDKYKIPMIIYAPKFLKPCKINYLASQIDIVPTVFDLLGWRYNSKFFGTSIEFNKNNKYRAFISNYQKLGYLENDKLAILEPKKITSAYKVNFSNFELAEMPDKKDIVFKAASYYQSANYLYKINVNTKK